MTARPTFARRDKVLIAVLIALVVVGLAFQAYLATRTPTYVLPRIVDEHGNNLLYVCPDDPRCHATVVTTHP